MRSFIYKPSSLFASRALTRPDFARYAGILPNGWFFQGSSSRSDGQAGPGKDLERALHGLGRRGLNLRQTAGLTEAAGLRQPRPMKREEVHLLHAGNRRREMGCGLEAGFIVLRRAGFDTGAA